jgi:hypothetical protein
LFCSSVSFFFLRFSISWLKHYYFKGEFSWAKIPVGEWGEGNINREIGFKGMNLVRKAVCNHDSKNCNSFLAAGVKV